MKALEVNCKNLGILGDFKATFPEAGLVYIQGGNEQGKSTLLRAIMTVLTAGKNDGMLTKGEANGFVEMPFIAADGNEYVCRLDLDPTVKERRLTILTPNGKITKVGDIKDFFGYNDFTVDNFIDWGMTPEGGRKQADIIISLLEKDVQEKYKKLQAEETASYNEREAINRDLTKKKGALKIQELSLEEQQEADLHKAYSDELIQVESDLSDFSTLTEVETEIKIKTAEKESLDQQVNLLVKRHKDCDTEIERLKSLIVAQEELKKTITEEGKVVREKLLTVSGELRIREKERTMYDLAKKTTLEQRKEYLVKEIDSSRTSFDKRITYNDLSLEVAKVQKEWEEESRRLTKIRNDKKNLTTTSLPIPDLVIEDGILYYEHEGNLFRFNATETATSVLIEKTVDIIMMINKHLKIVLISRGESLDATKREALHQKALKMDGLYIMELVDSGNVKMIIHGEGQL